MRIRTIGVVIAAMLVAMMAFDVMAQDAPRQRGERGERPAMGERGERGAMDMEAIRARRAEQTRERIGISEDEWVVLGPRIEKIQQLNQAALIGAFAGRMRRPGDDRELTAIEAATAQLTEVLRDANATADQISEALTALRLAREQQAQELAEAREELRDLVTARQEAQLVLMGILE